MAKSNYILLTAFSLLLGLWLRWPTVSEGLPYFYREDEAHHFNRLVNMAKDRTLNPQYFHKPSLHFYLRMTALAAGLAWNKYEGHLNSVKDVVTKDPFGVGDYRFSASHPGLVKWVRVVSLVFSLLMIPLALAIATRLSGSLVGGAAAGLLTAASPELISYASTVGVDTIMSFFCLLTVWLGLRVFERKTYGDIILCALAAGFAISTKYNAAPVAIVPITALWLAGVRDRRKLVASLLLPVAAFLLGSPYILISFSLFLKELSYEIWHYAIAGHEENTGSPGLGQAVHYITWIIRSALGLGALLCCVAGIWIAAKSADIRRWIVGIFPLLFFILMIAQKVNFTRNMLVIIPFVAIYAGVAIAKFSKRTNQTIAALAIILILSQPLLLSLRYRRSILNIQESRLAAAEWIESQAAAGEKIAWDGELQLIPSVLKLNNVDRVDLDQVKLNELAKNGYNHLLVAPQHFADWANNSERVFPGIAEPQRIVSNPEIRVVKLSKVP